MRTYHTVPVCKIGGGRDRPPIVQYSTLLCSLYALSSVYYVLFHFISFSLMLRLFFIIFREVVCLFTPYMIWYSTLSSCMIQWSTSPDEIPFVFRGDFFFFYPALLRLSLLHPEYTGSRLASLGYEYQVGSRPSAPSTHEHSTGSRFDLL